MSRAPVVGSAWWMIWGLPKGNATDKQWQIITNYYSCRSSPAQVVFHTMYVNSMALSKYEGGPGWLNELGSWIT